MQVRGCRSERSRIRPVYHPNRTADLLRRRVSSVRPFNGRLHPRNQGILPRSHPKPSDSAQSRGPNFGTCTARDWRDGIRKVGNTRICSDGTVIACGDPGRYNQPMSHSVHSQPPVISSRYLSLEDGLVIADRHSAGESMTAIATAIGLLKLDGLPQSFR